MSSRRGGRAPAHAGPINLNDAPAVALKSYEFMKPFSFSIFAATVGIFFAVYSNPLHKHAIPKDYHTVTLIFLVAFLLVSFVLGMMVQCHGTSLSRAAWCFLVMFIVFAFSLGFAIWVCAYPKGKWPGGTTFGGVTLLFLLIWACRFDEPKILHTLMGKLLALCGLGGNDHGVVQENAAEDQETYHFLKTVPFILYWAILVVLYEVYAHTAHEDDLPNDYKQACFIVLVAVAGIGFFLFFGTQLRGPAGDVGLAIWCFLPLMVIFICSLGHIVLICKYPNGEKPAICICTVGPVLLLFIWSFMFEKPECLHKFPGLLKCCFEGS